MRYDRHQDDTLLSAENAIAMTRIPRRHLWTDAACYHILNRGHNRTTIFADEEDRLAFLNLLARYRKRYGFRLYHYCLMSNHFHLLVQLERPRQLSTFMAGLLRAYVHHCHRRHQFVGHLWQGRFKSPVIQRLSGNRFIHNVRGSCNLGNLDKKTGCHAETLQDRLDR